MNCTSKKNKQFQGYTLIEMAVVLVIVGAAMATVFQGREMIENAHIKSVIQDFESFTQAHYAYIKRTGRAPGIARNPTTGVLLRDSFIGKRGYNQNYYFSDLIAEGFLLDKDLASSKDLKEIILQNSYGGDWSVSSSGYPHYPFLGSPQLCTEDLPLYAVKAIDVKMDDGNPRTGRVRSLVYYYSPETSTGGAWVNNLRPLLVDYTEENAPTIEEKYMACRLL